MTITGVDPLQVKGQQAIKKAAPTGPQGQLQSGRQRRGEGLKSRLSPQGRQYDGYKSHEPGDNGSLKRPAEGTEPQLGAGLGGSLGR